MTIRGVFYDKKSKMCKIKLLFSVGVYFPLTSHQSIQIVLQGDAEVQFVCQI